jgi:tRNA threonylcarbamoyladenosine biosynthesis protein TsaE
MREELKQGVVTETSKSTRMLARRLAEYMNFCGTVALTGDLGAGKTVFAKGLAEALGVRIPVKSPSYNVCLTYEGEHASFVHIDAYRLKSADDYDSLLVDEIVPDPKLVCVEWPQIVADALPPETLWLEINILNDDGSRIIRSV